MRSEPRAEHRVVDRARRASRAPEALAGDDLLDLRDGDARPRSDPAGGRRCRWRSSPAAGRSKSTTSRRNASGTWISRPAPSPVSALGARGAAVVEVAERADAVLDDLVARAALHVDDEVDAAGVVLEAGVVEALGRGPAERRRLGCSDAARRGSRVGSFGPLGQTTWERCLARGTTLALLPEAMSLPPGRRPRLLEIAWGSHRARAGRRCRLVGCL